MNTHCKQCGKESSGRKYCSKQCNWTWHNRNRTLTPNVIFNCEICGAHVEYWASPKQIKAKVIQGRFCSRTCAGIWRRGPNHPLWKGGVSIDRDGYVSVYSPDHPYANRKGYCYKHRLVMEKHLGRHLLPSEVVHHKNGNVSDNRIRNLKLYANNAEHKAEDVKHRQRDKKGRLIPCS